MVLFYIELNFKLNYQLNFIKKSFINAVKEYPRSLMLILKMDKHIPSSFELMSVQIVHRHGNRNFLEDYTKKMPNLKCTQIQFGTKYFLDSYKKDRTISTLSLDIRNILNNPVYFEPVIASVDKNDTSGLNFSDVYKENYSNNCEKGQLTDKGINLMEEFGKKLRQIYLTEYKFLAPNFGKNDVEFRAISKPRIIESLMCLLIGMFPEKFRKTPAQDDRIQINLLTKNQDSMTGTCYQEFKNLDKEYCRTFLKKYDKSCKNIFEDIKILKPETRSWKEAIYYLDDTFKCVHDYFEDSKNQNQENKAYKLYEELKSKKDELEKLSIRSNFGIYFDQNNGKKAAMLRIGKFIDELGSKFYHLVEKELKKFYIYSGSDDVIASILALFDLFDEKSPFPRFGSNIIFKLYKNKSTQEKFVTIKYNQDTNINTKSEMTYNHLFSLKVFQDKVKSCNHVISKK